MEPLEHPLFVWSDAWFLAALALGEAPPKSLGQVLAQGDVLQRAIMTREEVNGALGRLGRAALLSVEPGGRVQLTPRGQALCAAASGRHADIQAELEALLEAAPWTPYYHPRSALGREAEVVSASQYAQLVHGR